MSQQETSADGIMDLSTLSLNDMNFDSPLLSQSFNFGSSDLPTTSVPHPHLISTPYVSRQQLKPQFTSVVSPICQQQCARMEGDNNNNVVETNNNLTFNSPPIIHPSNAGLQATFDQPKMLEATFDQPQMQATFDQPKMLEATFDQPQLQATFDQPKMLEATFDQPQMQATFDQPKMLEATFDQPKMQATFDQPKMLEATFDQPQMQATFDKPQLQATFDQPQMQATFDQPQLQATFDQPKMLEATFDKPKMAAAGSTTFDRPQLQETFDKPNMLEATFDQPTASTTFDRPEKLQATLENGGKLMENSSAAAGQISFEQQMLELTDEQQSSIKFADIKGDDNFLIPPPLSNDPPPTDAQPSACNADQPLSPSNATFQMDTSPLTIHQQAPINPTSTSTDDSTACDAPTSTSTNDNACDAPTSTSTNDNACGDPTSTSTDDSTACGDGPNSTFRMETPLFNSTTGQKETSAITKPASLVGKPTATNKLTRTMTSTSSKTLSKPTTIAKPTLKKFVPLSQRSTISSNTSHKQQTKKIGGSSLLRPSSGLVAKKSGLRAPASGSSGAANTHRNQQDLKSGVSSAVVSSSSLLTNKTATGGKTTAKLQQKSSITSSISKTTSSPAPSSGYQHASSSVDKKPSSTTAGGDKSSGIGLQRKIAATRSMKAPSTTSSRLLNGKTSASSSSGLRAPVTSSLKSKSKVTSSSVNVSSISNRSNISNKSTTSSTTTSSNRKTSSTLSKPPSSRQSVYGRNKPSTTSSRYGQVKKSPSPTFNTIETQTDDDPHALTGPEANNLRRELEELRQSSYAKQAEYDNEREELKGNISELKNDLENLKNNFEEEYERLQEKYKEEVEKNENLQIQLEDEQAKVTEFEVKLHKMVEPKLKELLKPYENTYEECQSLKSVLDIKSEETRKLQTQLAQQRLKLSTNTNLENQMEKLKHQKEGIDAQLQRLQHEYSLTREELEREKLQNSLQERRNDELTREVEEMSFRLNSPQSNPPQSPFNPVFTVSASNNNNLGESRVVKQLDMNVSGKKRSDATS